MGRIMAFDFGKIRTGIAVTDDSKLIAFGLETVQTKVIFNFLEKHLAAENVDAFIVGEPKQMDYSESESEVLIKKFIQKLESKFPSIPIKRIDERFTSKMAFQSMIDGGLGKKQRRNKALVDKISATIILQTYLDQKQF